MGGGAEHELELLSLAWGLLESVLESGLEKPSAPARKLGCMVGKLANPWIDLSAAIRQLIRWF